MIDLPISLTRFLNALYCPNHHALVYTVRVDNMESTTSSTVDWYYGLKCELDKPESQRTYLLVQRTPLGGHDVSATLIIPCK